VAGDGGSGRWRGIAAALAALVVAVGAAHAHETAWVAAAVVVPGSEVADPSVLDVAGTLYAYGTNTVFGGHVPTLTSTDGRGWRRAGDALPRLPGWAAPSDTYSTWAPAVIRLAGRYRLYYTTRDASRGTECISVASSADPAGPFTDASAGPLVCQADLGGSIDPSPYLVAGVPYLTWKSEGGPAGPPTIWASRLRPDGTSTAGTPAVLLRPDRSWQDGVIEAPDLLARDGDYQLLYAAGDWRGQNYVTGVADCAGPLGPCHSASRPVMTSGPGAAGLHGRTGIAVGVAPGGASLFQRGNGWWMAFHTWSVAPESAPAAASRQLVIAPIPAHGRPVPKLGAVERGAVISQPS
jgi:beta-xylosidase